MKSGRVLWGLLCLVACILVGMEAFGANIDVNIFSLFITAILLYTAVTSLFRMEFGGILFSLSFILILNDERLGLGDLNTWGILVAATLGTIGLSLIFPNNKKRIMDKERKEYESRINSKDENYSNIYKKTSFGESTQYVNTNNLTEGKFKCSFGSMKVYFDNAQIQEQTAHIDVDCNCGEMKLFIPKEWAVDNRIRTTLAECSITNNRGAVITNTLIITGSVTLGEIEIILI